jgi:type IV pilus assembly protein PilE
MRHRNDKAGGHTLPELLVALAICAALAAVGVASWQSLARSQRRAEARSALLMLMQQQERHFSRHGRYHAFDAAMPGSFKWHSGASPADSAYILSATACDGESLARCVSVVARPGGPGARANHADPDCGVLRLDSRGQRRADGRLAACWP